MRAKDTPGSRAVRTLGLAVVALLAGGSGIAARDLAGTTWTLAQLGGEPDRLEPPVTLVFGADGTVSGSDGCNRYHGACAIEGSSLRLGGELAVTGMACAPPLESRAAAWHRALASVAAYERAGSGLVLKGAAGETLAVLREQGGSVVGVWTVVGYDDGEGGVVSVAAGTELTATFGSKGRVTGRGGCNRYFADYRTAGNRISIGAAGTTRMHCDSPETVMEQESLFLAALERSATFRLEGDRLTLRSAEGSIQVTLSRGGGSQGSPAAKITFDLDPLDADGLLGANDGRRALRYEYCVPNREDVLAKVRAIDPTLQVQGESPGRIGCGEGELLCLGSTHQNDWRKILEALAALPEIREIREAVFE